MKLSQILSYLAVLLVGGAIGYFVGASSGKSNKPASDSPTAVAAEPSQSEGTTNTPTETSPEPSEPTTATPSSAPTTTATTPSTTPTTPSPAPAGALPDADLCFTGDQLGNLLTQYAEKIEGLQLAYDPSKMQDCSGIFFRLIDEFAKKRCPDYAYPDPKSARPCRMIAHWYYEHKNFSFLEDPMGKRNLIKPGAVLFFGPPNRSFKNMTVERMCGPSGAIHHIGVVTSVEKDEQGNLLSYTLFHGQTYGKNASRTYHSTKGPSRLNYPVLGFGSEQLVAISYLFTPVT